MDKCLACGIEKDMSVLEIYPYQGEEDRLCDEPIEPLIIDIHCSPCINAHDVACDPNRDWRLVTVCHECFKKLDVDHWTCENHWNQLNPITKFDDLPILK